MPWNTTQPLPLPRGVLRILDPYFMWIAGPGRDDYLLRRDPDDQTIPVLRRFDPLALARLREAIKNAKRTEEEKAEQLAALPKDIDLYLLSGTELPDRASLDKGLRAFPEVLRSVTFGPPVPKEVAPRRGPVSPPTPPSGKKGPAGPVVVGIVDDGLAFGHERFRKPDGTSRIEAVWIQDGAHAGGSAGVSYGREITKSEIDAWLKGSKAGGAVDEERFYETAGVAEFSSPLRKSLAAHASHGAHVMDIACGFDPADAPDWKIVCVQLPVATTADSSGATLAPFAVDAVKYIQAKAAQLSAGGAMPSVVINFSYGLVAGPHNGRQPIERAVDQILTLAQDATQPPLHVVIPSGNSHLARAHAVVAAAARSQPVELFWRLQPDDLTPSFLEIYIPGRHNESRPRVQISVKPPGEDLPGPWVTEDETTVVSFECGGEILCEASYHVQSDTEQGMFLVAVQPTARVDADAALENRIAPHGLWTVQVQNLELDEMDEIHAWVQRDDAPFGYPRRGRQSYFDHADYERFDHGGREIEKDDGVSKVRRASCINAIATGNKTIVIGGMAAKDLRASKYSAGGPLLPGDGPVPRPGPHVMTLSNDSVAHAGVLAAGTRSGSVVAMNGTSVAAPRITRWIAGQLSAGNHNVLQALEALATAADAQLPKWAEELEPTRMGAGRLRFLPGPITPEQRGIEP